MYSLTPCQVKWPWKKGIHFVVEKRPAIPTFAGIFERTQRQKVAAIPSLRCKSDHYEVQHR
ncbi:MAG: hypothetical protein IT260_15140 [Saprospiraceae bacterium]|nr:hypothetical protein [Saprospiraceae bacterium]